jgi:hypothetical protein
MKVCVYSDMVCVYAVYFYVVYFYVVCVHYGVLEVLCITSRCLLVQSVCCKLVYGIILHYCAFEVLYCMCRFG